MRQSARSIGYGVLAIALAVAPLAGCSAGASNFGNSNLEAAELPNIGSYTAEGALSEARAHFRNNDFGYSAALYKRAAELAPKNAEAYVGLGASYDRLGRFDLSDRVYEALFKLSGGTVQYYNNVGYSYMLRGNLSAAVKSFKKAITMDPDNIVVANNLQIVANAAKA
ncbi:MAG: tetratricopeptide repeat protein [Devosia sp.]